MSETHWLTGVVEAYDERLCRYAYSLCGCQEAARDAVQETFLRLLKEEQARVEAYLQAWLFKVCRSRVFDRMRKEGKMVRLAEEFETTAPPRTDPAAMAEERETLSGLMRALVDLPARDREVLRLKFRENMSYRQIAEVTELSESNVGVILHAALKQLRRQLAQKEN